MPTCIYCRETKDAGAFTKTEHVLPQAFGRFEQNLTLNDVVCDDCNQFFGDTLERPFARDSPDGLERFIRGAKHPSEYKSLGRRSSMRFRIDDGPLAGAMAVQRPVDGVMRVEPLPQVGVSASGEPPITWFPVDALPEKDIFQGLFDQGMRHIQILSVWDAEPVHRRLREIGLEIDVLPPGPPPSSDSTRVEWLATLDDTFGRTITKIALNYLAYTCDAHGALRSEFDSARRYARYGEGQERIWRVLEGSVVSGGDPGDLWHALALSLHPETGDVLAQISFHGPGRVYMVRLAAGANFIEQREGIGHLFDLRSRRVRQMVPQEAS